MRLAQARARDLFQLFDDLERLCPLTLRRVDHARIENQKRVVLPLLLCFFQFRERFVEQFILNVHSYFPAGAESRAEFIGLPQQSKCSPVISLQVVRLDRSPGDNR